MPGPANLRLRIGIALLVLGVVLSIGAIPVLRSDWPAEIKGPLAGAMAFSIELMAIPAAAIMGRENFDRIMASIKRASLGLLSQIRPASEIGPRRHAIGLVLFVLPILVSYLSIYAPGMLPEGAWRLAFNLAADGLFILSLFVLGGDFWDKLRALFIRRARAVFPDSDPPG